MKFKLAPGVYIVKQFADGPVLAHIVKTGTRRDNYPWEWYLHQGVRFGARGVREQGTTQTLGEAVDLVESRIHQYGVEMEK